MTMRLCLAAVLAILAFGCCVQPARAAAPCSSATYHQYDFFVGSWIVKNKHGKQFATDLVTKEFRGCVLWERWYGRSSHGAGYTGYDAARKIWVQNFMMDDGTVLSFEGRAVGTSMLFHGPSYPKAGVVEQNRVVFRKLPEDRVEEFWTVSHDGKTWTTVFDGFFSRASAKA
ncbi:MAG: hypothetical protein ABI186_09045 [Candidatus Elarobacter sp.]